MKVSNTNNFLYKKSNKKRLIQNEFIKKSIKNTAYLLLALISSWNSYSQQQTITICSEKNGCEFAKVNLNKSQVDNILNKPNFLAREKGQVILNLIECISTIEKNKTPQAIHVAYGGKGTIKEIKNFDLKQYLINKGCLGCPNTTKRISFQATTEDFNGSGYYFHNIQKEESFMPNSSWQLVYQGEMGELVQNTYIKKNEHISYTIDTEGNKWKIKMPYGTIYQDLNETTFSAKFNKNFKKTGTKKKFLNTSEFQYEYIGKDGEGKTMKLWLGPSGNVCYPIGKTIVTGFFNLGYIVVDGITYLISEVSGSNFNVKVTGIEEGSYSFDPVGYIEFKAF